MCLLAAFTLITSCKKEMTTVNYLPGKWNLVQTELYENDSLKAVAHADEITTVYYFSSCETNTESACDMYVEEDGEQHYYPYVFDSKENSLMVGETSIFTITSITETQLCLVRTYDTYQSVYFFTKSE